MDDKQDITKNGRRQVKDKDVNLYKINIEIRHMCQQAKENG